MKKLITLLFVLALVTMTFADAVQVGTGTATLRTTKDSVDYELAGTGTRPAPYVNMSNGSTTLAEDEIWNFYDSGGASGQYGNSENFSYTFNPPAGYRCIVRFSAFTTESRYDVLKIYDGTAATGTSIGEYSGTTIPPDYIATNSGSLTFFFKSDSSNSRVGWAATISAEALPQVPVLAHSPLSL